MKKKVMLSTLTLCMSVVFNTYGAIEPEEGAKLLLWTEEAALPFMKQVAADFEKEYGINVEVKEENPIDAVRRLMQDGGNSKVADIIEFEHDTLGQAVAAGVLMENLVTADNLASDFIESANSASHAVFEGEPVAYGFPISFGTTAIFYNKDILAQAPKSFEELIEKTTSFTSIQENRYGLLWDIQNYYESRMFLAMFGGYEFGNNGLDPNDLGIAKPESVEGLEAMLALKAISAPSAADMGNPQVRRGLFSEGKVAAIVDGPWAVSTYDTAGLNYGIAPMPTFKGKPMPNFASVKLAGVSSFTQYPKAAQLFADYMTSHDVLLARYKALGSIPARKSAIDEVLKDESNPSKAFAEQGLYAQSMPAITAMGYVWQPMSAALSDIWDKNAPVQESLDKAALTITQQIDTQK